jgi:Restriction endonuclease
MAVRMHRDLLIKAIAGIMPETIVTLDEFQAASGITSKSVARKLIDFLLANDVASASENMITFSGSDRLRAAMLALRMNCDVEQVSKYLSWKDFEKLTAEALKSYGYCTQVNVRLTKPRMEIDVVGTSTNGFAIAVDCKHWQRNNLSMMSIFAQKQAARAKRLLKYDRTLSQVVPLMLTLHVDSVKFVGRVPLVPIHMLRSFIIDLKGFLPEIYVANSSDHKGT